MHMLQIPYPSSSRVFGHKCSRNNFKDWFLASKLWLNTNLRCHTSTAVN